MLSTKLMIAMVALVVSTAVAVGVLTYRNLSHAIVHTEQGRLEAEGKRIGLQLNSVVDSAKNGVLSLRRFPAMKALARIRRSGGVDPEDGATEQVWLTRLATIFAADLEANPSFNQFMLLGPTGKQQLCVDRYGAGNAIRRVPEPELVDAREQNYFKYALYLSRGEVYVSEVVLNQGKGAAPAIPLIRVAAPVHFPDGQVMGVLVIYLDMRPVFNLVRDWNGKHNLLYLCDREGNYLIHPDRSRELAYSAGKDHPWQQDFSEFKGIFSGQNKPLYFHPPQKGWENLEVVVPVRPGGGPPMAIIQTISEDNLLAILEPIERSSFLGATLAAFAALICGALIANSLTRPLRMLTRKVHQFDGESAIVLPLKTGGEVGLLSQAFQSMSEDIRQRTATLKDLYEREHELASVVEWSADAVVGMDVQGKITSWNPAAQQLYGFTEEEAIGQSIEMVVPDDWKTEARELLASVRRERAATQMQTVRKDREGKLLNISLTLSPVKDDNGEVLSLSEIARDVTERRRLEQRLRQAQKMEALGTLAGGIAHDFNNIIAAIVGNVALAKADAPGREAQESLREIEKATSRATYIVRQILTFSRPIEENAVPVDLGLALNDSVKLLQATIPPSIEVSVECEPGLPPVDGAETEFHQLLLNLGINAAHAMKEKGGKFEVRASKVMLDEETAKSLLSVSPGPYVRISVGDTGCGMDAQTLQRVFEPFFTTKPPGEGTGLGLAVVYGIVERHRGAITVYSEPNKGTLFHLYFPVSEREVEVDQVEQSAPLEGKGERILYVDDDEALVFMMTRTLKRLGYQVTGHQHPREALEAFRADPYAFDVVISDISMPYLDGPDLAQKLLEIRSDVPIIMTTGYIRPEDTEKARTLGDIHLVLKPNTVHEMGQVLREVLEGMYAKGAVKASGAS